MAGALELYPKASGQGKVLHGGWELGNVISGREYSSLIQSWKQKKQIQGATVRAGMLNLSPLYAGAKAKDFVQAHALSCSDLLLKDVLDGCTAVRPKELVVKGRGLPPQSPSYIPWEWLHSIT